MDVRACHTARPRTARRVLAAGCLLVLAASLLPVLATASVAAGCLYPGTASGRLTNGQSLAAGQVITSPSGRYTFGLDALGRPALTDTSTGGRIWVASVAQPATALQLTTSGTAQAVTATGVVVWGGATTGSCGALVAEDLGRVGAYNATSLLWTIPKSAATTTPTPTATATAATAGRNAALYPFASTAPWNVAVGSGATFDPATGPQSSVLLTGSPAVNSTSWSIAVYQATATDPMSTVTDLTSGLVYTLRIPAGATATGGTDRHVGVIDPTGHTGDEFYDFTQVTSTSWTSTRATVTDLYGDGMSGGSRASNVSVFAGLIRAQELANLSISHALALAVPASMLQVGPVWPASMQDSDAATTYTGTLPMGTMVAIPPTVDLTTLGLTPEGLALGRALQNYGAYVLLQAQTVALYAEPAADQTQVGRLRDAWATLYPLVRVVTDSSPASVGGGGAPRVAALAALGS